MYLYIYIYIYTYIWQVLQMPSKAMQKIAEIVQAQAASYPELAEICHLGEFPKNTEVPEVPEDSGLDAWSFGDPMLSTWKFRLASQLPKLAKQLGDAKKNTWSLQLAVLGAVALGVAIPGKILEWPAWQIFLAGWLSFTSFQLMQFVELGFELKFWLQQSWKLQDHLSFVHSCSGGNIVKILLSLFDKLSCVELRLMFLVSREVGRQLRQICEQFKTTDQLKQEVSSLADEFLSARQRFKDMKFEEIGPAWEKIFKEAVSQAIQQHEKACDQEPGADSGSTKLVNELTLHVGHLKELQKMKFPQLD